MCLLFKLQVAVGVALKHTEHHFTFETNSAEYLPTVLACMAARQIKTTPQIQNYVKGDFYPTCLEHGNGPMHE